MKSPSKKQTEASEAWKSIDAAITKQDVEEMERGASSQGIGQVRRVCLMVCSMTGQELRQASLDHPETFGEMLDAVESFQEHVKALNEVAEAAMARLIYSYQDADTGKTSFQKPRGQERSAS